MSDTGDVQDAAVAPGLPHVVNPSTADVSANLDVDAALAEASRRYLAAQKILADTRAVYLAAQQAWFDRRGL